MSEENSNPPRPRRDRGLIVAIIALLINVITVSVYLYQSKIMREQQYASAWPYIEWVAQYSQGEGYKLVVNNNGVGPAIIKEVDIQLNGRSVENIKQVFDYVLDSTMYPYISGSIENRVIPAGSGIQMAKVNDDRLSELAYYRLDYVDTVEFTMSICYESIYGETWTSTGTSVVTSVCP